MFCGPFFLCVAVLSYQFSKSVLFNGNNLTKNLSQNFETIKTSLMRSLCWSMLKVNCNGVPMVCSRDRVLVIWHDSSYLPRTELFQRPFFKLNSPLKILLVRTNAIQMHEPKVVQLGRHGFYSSICLELQQVRLLNIQLNLLKFSCVLITQDY